VEDCAQAFDGFQYIGHFDADISFFSFGPIKSCTALGGSVTLVKQAHLAKQMHRIEQIYPVKSEWWFLRRILKYLCLKVISQPHLFGIFVACLDFLKIDLDQFISSLSRGFSQGDIQSQLRYRPPNQMLKLLQARLERLDPCHYQKRAERARHFWTVLNQAELNPGNTVMRHSYWLLPLMTEEPQLLMQRLRRAGFDTTTGTTSLTVLGESAMQAKQLIKHLLYLPIHPSIPTAEVVRLSQLIQQSSRPHDHD
jgi:perosamine synthetase